MTEISIDKINLLRSFSENLSKQEVDALKYRLSIEAVKAISDDGSVHPKEVDKFNLLLEGLVSIQDYRARVPEYGLAYKGRPDFMTDCLFDSLLQESERFQSSSYKNLDQYIYQVETENNCTHAEKLAASEELHCLVNEFAGLSVKSFVTSYLYYNKKGQCSRPHVDNAFTSITVMVGLKQTSISGKKNNLSSSFIYWPKKPRLNYQLQPGEVAIFFGATVLHGRTKLREDEETSSLLMSFRPIEV